MKPLTPQTSIRTHLLLLVLAVSVPLLAMVGWGIYHDFQQSVAQTKASLRTLAHIMVTNTDSKIAYAHDILDRLAKRRASTTPVDAQHCDLSLADMHSMLPGFTNIGYTNPEGDIVCSALVMNKPLNVGKADWFQALQTNQRFTVGPPFIGVISKKWVLVLTQPLWNESLQVVGGINVSLNLNSYDPEIPTQHLPPGSRYGFLADDGMLIWRNADAQGLIGTRLTSEAARRSLSVRDGEFEAVGSDGVPSVYAVVPMPQAGWLAFVTVPQEPVYREALQRALATTALALGAIGVMVLMALAIARRIAVPVAQLEGIARTVQGGDLTVRAAHQGPREVVAVAQAFNAMLDARQRGALELAQSETRYRTLIEHAPEAIVVLDLAPQEPCVVDANPSAEKLFGGPLKQLVGKPLAGFYAPDPSGGFPKEPGHDAFFAQVSAGEVVHAERHILTLDGRRLICAIHLVKLPDAEHRLLRLTLVDITQRKQGEAQIIELNQQLDNRVRERTLELQQALDGLRRTQDKLVQSEKLAALASIVAAVAHEMNTPIGNCLMVASTQDDHARAFERVVLGGAPFKRAQLLEHLAASRTANELLLRGLRRTIDLVENFKQIAAKQGTAQRREFRLIDPLSDVVALLKTSLPMAAYPLELVVADGLTLESYPAALEQIVTHLIGNAVLHAFAGRSEGVMRLTASLHGDDVHITFTDNGCGMPDEVRKHVFDPFFTTRLGQGSNGLGMSICYNLVTGPLGGCVELTSALGIGTSVTLVIPRVAP